MKKLILLLLFIPLVSFGQDWENVFSKYLSRSSSKPFFIPTDFDNNTYLHTQYKTYDGKIKDVLTEHSKSIPIIKHNRYTEIYEPYLGISTSITKRTEYRLNNGELYLLLESSYKGNYLEAPIEVKPKDLQSYNSSAFNASFWTIPDGFFKVYKKNSSETKYEAFFIMGVKIFELDKFTDIAAFRYPDGVQTAFNLQIPYRSKTWTINEYDLEPMINLFLEDYLNNYLAVGLPKGLLTVEGRIYEGKVVQLLAPYKSKPLIFKEFKEMFNIKAIFEPLEGETLALSYGFNDDKNIVLKVDPEKWAKASSAKRWYTLYHELGHDVLNFQHGQGGKMMFNFSETDYTWEAFEKDRNYMFNKAIKNAKKRNKLF